MSVETRQRCQAKKGLTVLHDDHNSARRIADTDFRHIQHHDTLVQKGMQEWTAGPSRLYVPPDLPESGGSAHGLYLDAQTLARLVLAEAGQLEAHRLVELDDLDLAVEEEEAQHRKVLAEKDAQIAEQDREIGRQRDLNETLQSKLKQRMNGASPSDLLAFVERQSFVPADLQQAVSLAEECLEGVVIHPRAFDRPPKSNQSTWPESTWNFLQFLNDYALDPAWSGGGIFEYSKSGRSKHHVGRYELAMQESETVKGRNRTGPHKDGNKSRWFPVDRQVNSAGLVRMAAHFKKGTRNGSQMLRIHFHDDTSGPTGKVHIGYIGDHLHTEKTN